MAPSGTNHTPHKVTEFKEIGEKISALLDLYAENKSANKRKSAKRWKLIVESEVEKDERTRKEA